MKKILFISDYLVAGGAENVLNITMELLKKDYYIDIFYGSKEKKLPNNPCSYIFSLKFKNQLLKKLIDYKPNIIILFNYYHLLSPSILYAIKQYKKKNKVKVIMSVHDFHILSPNSGFYYYKWFSKKLINLNRNPSLKDMFLYKWDERGVVYNYLKLFQWIFNYKILKLHNVIDVFMSPSEFLASFLKEKFNRVYMVRNPLFNDNQMIESIEYSQKDSKNIQLVYFGRVSYEKGLFEFINKLKDIDLDYTFSIIGKGDENYLNKLQQLINKNKLENRIIFLGYKRYDELLKILNKYDIFVLPSLWYENAPLSLVEASMNGLKLLTMNYGGMKEIAKICGNCCLLDKDYNSMDIKKCIINLRNKQFAFNNKIIELFSYINYQKNVIKLIEGDL